MWSGIGGFSNKIQLQQVFGVACGGFVSMFYPDITVNRYGASGMA